MVRQNETMRRMATGGFRDLLIAMSQDPAMVWWLDNRMNVKEHPNENFAREIMELFALGVGNYTEKDIREAARAFTGWTEERLQFVDRKEHHDAGEKTVFGKTGNFDGYAVIDLILAQEAAPRFLAGKLYRYFSREELDADLHAKLAKTLRDGNFQLKPFLTTLFLSRDFYSPASYATQIKSPVLLAVSTARKLGLQSVPGAPDFRAFCQVQGEELFYPPNVAGWTGGRTWINPATLIARANYLDQVLFPDHVEPPEAARAGAMMAADMLENAPGQDGKGAEPMGGASMTALTAERTEDYNTRSASRVARRLAVETVKVDRTPADFDLSALLRAAGVESGEEAVDHLTVRFLRVPLSEKRRVAMLDFIRAELPGSTIDYDAEGTEAALRQLLHLILSVPEYQLS
jgi:hypothetical protein